MLRILQAGLLLIASLHLFSCNGQNLKEQKNVLSDDFDTSPPYYYKMPKEVSSSDTSPGWKMEGQKILLTGTVYELDGKTPAQNVILYYYQTDVDGRYTTKESEERNMPINKLGQTHGYIRGWLKTDSEGKYSIYTIKPGSYPSRDEAAHVHITIKEKNMKEPYYIDNFVFDDDPLLTANRRKRMENRGGSGVVRFVQKEELWIGERNIYLGLNIPDYPIKTVAALNSGRSIGEDVLSFTPFHAYGPDKNTKTCPVCKYGWFHGILYFVGNNPNWEEIKEWLVFLELESTKSDGYLKVYFVYGNERDFENNHSMAVLESLGNDLDIKNIALTFVPSFTDRTSEVYLNQINPNVENTFLIYKRSNIVEKYVDLKPTEGNFKRIINRIDQTKNQYYMLSRPKKG